MLDLHVSQLTWVSVSSLIFVFSYSKGAKLKGSPETVRIKDVQLIRALKVFAAKSGATGRLFPFSYSEVGVFLKSAAIYSGLPEEQVTTHCLRRGGATWHFVVFATYDLAAEHGRWRHIMDSRNYINSAMADLAEVTLSEQAKLKLAGAAKAWPAVLTGLR